MCPECPPAVLLTSARAGNEHTSARIAPRAIGAGRYDGAVSQVDPAATDPSEVLDRIERVWLEERLREYRELLAYLRDH
jgi:hypothetical protein